MPLVSEDYGALGSVSGEELTVAQETARDRGLSNFFAPVFLIDPGRTPVGWLADEHGVVVNAAQISDRNCELQRFLGTVLTSMLAREDGS